MGKREVVEGSEKGEVGKREEWGNKKRDKGEMGLKAPPTDSSHLLLR